MTARNTIEFVLTYEQNIKDAIEDKRADGGRQKVGGNGSGHCRISDPTMMKAFRNILPVGTVEVPYGCAINGVRDVRTLRKPEKWLKVADATWEHFDGTKGGELMKARYRESRKPYETWEKLGIHKARYYVILDMIISYAETYARGIGALPPFERRILGESTTHKEQTAPL